jgi:cytochrome c oxidase assembly protein subunit 11
VSVVIDGTARKNRRVAARLLILTSVMFGFGYALVPLYDVFCDLTGLNGKTGRLSEAAAERQAVDLGRSINIEFVTNVNAGMPWEFKPVVAQVRVHPGEETLVYFEATNTGGRAITGNAVPSVSPNAVARYFNKTECFCFTQQALQAGETRMMPVRFVVDPKIPEDVTVLTLAYTFFESLKPAESAGAAG